MLLDYNDIEHILYRNDVSVKSRLLCIGLIVYKKGEGMDEEEIQDLRERLGLTEKEFKECLIELEDKKVVEIHIEKSFILTYKEKEDL